MRKQLLISIFIFLFIASCMVNHVKSVTTFSIEGRVYDSKSKQPLENVCVYFIDTGYDSTRSKKKLKLEIGQSDEIGEIKARLNYFWGYEDYILLKNPERTFDIVLAKESYETKIFHFEEAQFEGEKYTYFVKLEDVYMQKEEKQ